MQLTKLLTLSQFIDSLDNNGYKDSLNLVWIFSYNNFLKQPLTKEMFVGDNAIITGLDHFNFTDILISVNTKISFTDSIIYDLAEATNGTLTLKNVEI